MGRPYANTISGLVKRRAELMGEAVQIKNRMGAIANDVAAIDRVLTSMGHVIEPTALKARCIRDGASPQAPLRRTLAGEMREAGRPLTTRDLALRIVAIEGRNADDQRLMADMVRRIGKSLRVMQKRGITRATRDRLGHCLWELTLSLRHDVKLVS